MDSEQIVKFIKQNTMLKDCSCQQIFSIAELNGVLQKFNELQTCKNCSKYSPISDWDSMLIEDHEKTLCNVEHPEWGCKDFEEKI